MRQSDNNTLTIDIIDLLTEILRSWKKVLIITLVVAILSACFLTLKSRSTVVELDEATMDEQHTMDEQQLREQKELAINEARSHLTEAEIAEVDRLKNQLNSYMEYRKVLQEDFSSYMAVYDEGEAEQVTKRISFSLQSSLEGAYNLFTSSALGIDDFKKIRDILPEADTLTAAYNYVSTSAISRNETAISNMGEGSTVFPSQYMINVDMIGNSRAICDDISEVVIDAFERELKVLQKVDKNATLEVVGTQYRGNIYEYIANKQQPTFETIQKIDTTINNLINNSIGKLSGKQMTYYQLIMDPEKIFDENGKIVNAYAEVLDDETLIEEEGSQHITFKNIVMGLLFGLVLSILCVMIPYLLNGRIKTGEEIEDYFKISLLDTVFLEGNNKGFFSRLIKILRKADSISLESKAAMTAIDVSSLMKKRNLQSLYVIQSYDDPEDVRAAEMIKDMVSDKMKDAQIINGLPLSYSEEMQKMTQQKSALLLVHDKKSLRSDVQKLVDICRRHDIIVYGAIAIENV